MKNKHPRRIQTQSLYAPKVFRPPIDQIQSHIQILKTAIKKRQQINSNIALQMFYSSTNHCQRMIAYKSESFNNNIKTKNNNTSHNTTISNLPSQLLHHRLSNHKINGLIQKVKNIHSQQSPRSSIHYQPSTTLTTTKFKDIKLSLQEEQQNNKPIINNKTKNSFLVKKKSIKFIKNNYVCASNSTNKQNIQPQNINTSNEKKTKKLNRRQSVKGYSSKVSYLSGKLDLSGIDKCLTQMINTKLQKKSIEKL